jgi:trehalose utilization protein
MKMINVTVWNESEGALGAYPDGIHNVIAGFLRTEGAKGEIGEVRTATLNQPEHGLTDGVLEATDVLIWWGHKYHHKVDDGIVEKVRQRVLSGMGLILLHSSHASKIFQRLAGTNTNRLRWRDAGELERVWFVSPAHPIAKGLPEYFEVPKSEMYGEYFHIPEPDDLITISWYEGGEVFRSGCTFKRGLGKIFFFSPGHEEYPIYYMPEIQKIIVNGIRWAAPPEAAEPAFDHMPESPNAAYFKLTD